MPRSITTDRLRLRPWRESDAPVYRQLWSERDPRSLRLIGADGRPTVDDLTANVRSQLTELERVGFGLLAVERRDRHDLIGYCGLIVREASPAEPEFAFEFLRAVHGRGFGTESARAVRDAAAATGRRQLWADVRAWNTASLRVLEKVGFEPSGEVRADPERGDVVVLRCPLVPTL